MIKIENAEIQGLEPAFRGLRNPMNSWDKNDSLRERNGAYYIGEKDKSLALRMNISTSESKYRRMIVVWCDIIAPLYWWKEFETYKVGTVSNSCSTMHKIASKDLTLDDFSCDHLSDASISVMSCLIEYINKQRSEFAKTQRKNDWWQIIQLLPESYNQRRTIMLNYEVLAKQYKERRGHKLDEWQNYCKWIESLPNSELIIGGQNID